MAPINLTDLIRGLVSLILVAFALGQLTHLEAFARHEAAASLRGWDTHAFFPREYKRIIEHSSGHHRR